MQNIDSNQYNIDLIHIVIDMLNILCWYIFLYYIGYKMNNNTCNYIMYDHNSSSRMKMLLSINELFHH